MLSLYQEETNNDSKGGTSMPRIAAVQMSMSEDMHENYEKSLKFIKEAAEAGCQMVCFPEGQLTHYLPQFPGLDISEFGIPIYHEYVKGLCHACRDYNIIGGFSITLKENKNYYPVSMIVDEQGDILTVQKKHHIVRAYHFYEQDYYTPGNDGFKVVDTSIGRIGTIVCFDRHFPESWRTLALKGADFVFTPVANEKAEPSDVFQWEIRIPAFQNSFNTLMVNRVGLEGEMDYCGESVFSDASGNVVALGDDQEGLVIADLDFDVAVKIRSEKQYMPLRRSDVFELD